MRRYEVMFILKPNLEDAKIKTQIENLNKTLKETSSKVEEKKEIGLKDLAYPIQKFTNGYYYWMLVSASQEGISEVKRVIGINENIIRSIIVREDN